MIFDGFTPKQEKRNNIVKNTHPLLSWFGYLPSFTKRNLKTFCHFRNYHFCLFANTGQWKWQAEKSPKFLINVSPLINGIEELFDKSNGLVVWKINVFFFFLKLLKMCSQEILLWFKEPENIDPLVKWAIILRHIGWWQQSDHNSTQHVGKCINHEYFI